MKIKNVVIAADHAGFELKKALLEYVAQLGYSVTDMGAKTLVPGDDYPPIIMAAAMEVARDPENVKGIVIGGSGDGEAIMSNRLPGVRAAMYYGGNLDIVKLSREHNNANILSLGARFISVEDAKIAVKLWFDTEFSGDERHARRIEQIDSIE